MPSTACWEFPCCNTSTGRRRWPGPGCPWNNCLRNSVKSCSSRCSIRLGRKKHPTVWPWFCQKRPWFSKAWPNSWAWTHCGRADKGNTRAAPSISFRSATYLCFFGIPSKLPLEVHWLPEGDVWLFGVGPAGSLGIECAQVRTLQEVICAGFLLHFVDQIESLAVVASGFRGVSAQTKCIAQQVLNPRSLQARTELFAPAQGAVQFLACVRVILRVDHGLGHSHRAFKREMLEVRSLCLLGDVTQGWDSRCRLALRDGYSVQIQL